MRLAARDGWGRASPWRTHAFWVALLLSVCWAPYVGAEPLQLEVRTADGHDAARARGVPVDERHAAIAAAIPVQRAPTVESTVEATGQLPLSVRIALALFGLVAFGYFASRNIGRRAKADPDAPRTSPFAFLQRPPRPAAAVARVAGVRLTPKHSLHVVEWEGRRLLVGCSEQGIGLIAEAALAEVVAPQPAASAAELLRKAAA